VSFHQKKTQDFSSFYRKKSQILIVSLKSQVFLLIFFKKKTQNFLSFHRKKTQDFSSFYRKKSQILIVSLKSQGFLVSFFQKKHKIL